MSSALSKSLFSDNRKRLYTHIEDNSIAIIISNPEYLSNGDAFYPYEQNSALLWVCGIAQAETIFVLVKKKKKVQEYLFIKKPNPSKEIWDGRLLRTEDAKALSGIDTILYTEDFPHFLPSILNNISNIYLHVNENDRKPLDLYSAEIRYAKTLKKMYPLHTYRRLAPIFKGLRMQKNKYEIERIQKAIDITKDTFIAILQTIAPGQNERDIVALIHYHFIKNGGSIGFPSILAGGDNARILHYVENDQPLNDKELLLIDFGARKDFYNADISRTIPVNGKFTARQKEVYDACLHLHNYAKSLLKPNVFLTDYTQQVGKEATKVFQKIGLLTKEDIKNENPNQPAYRKYLYHGISHHLGIDVHDLSNMAEMPLSAGMVLTVEPGIYIEAEKIGIRIETDVLITPKGCQDLGKDIPITTEEIERIMKRKK